MPKADKDKLIHVRRNAAGEVTSWQVKLRRRGYPDFIKTYSTRDEAEFALSQVLLDHQRGLRIDHRAADRITLAEILAEAIDSLKSGRRRVKGKDEEIYRLERVLRQEPRLCENSLSALTRFHFEDWIVRRLENVKPGTVKRDLVLLRPLLRRAALDHHLAASPLDGVPNPKVQDERISRFQLGEEERLFAELSACSSLWVYPTAVFALETAARRGEMLSLEWQHFDRTNGTIWLPDAKNGRGRYILLTNRAQGILDNLPGKTGNLIFKTSAETLKQAFERARERALMPHWRWHDFRHEAISRLFDAGWRAEQVMDFSGHVDIKSLLRYRHPKHGDAVARLRKVESDNARTNGADRLRAIV